MGARIIAVCDAFHAMTSNRPYGRAIDAAEALCRAARRNAGSQFDPRVIDAFCLELRAGRLELARAAPTELLAHGAARLRPCSPLPRTCAHC